MVVDAGTRRLALYRILLAHPAGKGHGMAVPELQLAWMRTGLRESDLNLVLRDLKHANRIGFETSHRGLRIKLTPVGEREARWPVSGLLTLVIDWLTLTRIRRRQRQRGALTDFRQRRLGDRPGHAPR